MRAYFCPLAQALGEGWIVATDIPHAGIVLPPDGSKCYRLSLRAHYEALRFDETGQFETGTYILKEIEQ
jgi:hypothetical protein